MYNIKFDVDGGSRDKHGRVLFERVHRLSWYERPTDRSFWIGRDQSDVFILRPDIHDWFLDMNIPYTIHWRWDEISEPLDCLPRNTVFRWEVDIANATQATLVKLTWGI